MHNLETLNAGMNQRRDNIIAQLKIYGYNHAVIYPIVEKKDIYYIDFDLYRESKKLFKKISTTFLKLDALKENAEALFDSKINNTKAIANQLILAEIKKEKEKIK